MYVYIHMLRCVAQGCISLDVCPCIKQLKQDILCLHDRQGPGLRWKSCRAEGVGLRVQSLRLTGTGAASTKSEDNEVMPSCSTATVLTGAGMGRPPDACRTRMEESGWTTTPLPTPSWPAPAEWLTGSGADITLHHILMSQNHGHAQQVLQHSKHGPQVAHEQQASVCARPHRAEDCQGTGRGVCAAGRTPS